MAIRYAILVLFGLVNASASRGHCGEDLVLHARSRTSDNGVVSTTVIRWRPAETAAVVCDMWDQHWCAGATRRVAEMAPRMNILLNQLRDRGVLIIHCPSSCLDHYRDTPPRKLALGAPPLETQRRLEAWCHLDKNREGALPIDDSDGGCDCQPVCKGGSPWTRQIATIEVKEGDAVTDDAQAFYLMKQRGINNVIVMGVHTNMCVLGRPFSIRQMVYQGQNVVLMRDMTDTMYNSRSAPFVSHFTGTDLVIDHIERHWCPTVASSDFLGGTPFRFQADRRKHLAIVMGEDEYDAARTLPDFARQELGRDFKVSLVFSNPKNKHDFPEMSALDHADMALIAVRRRAPSEAQMKFLRKFIAAGKPLVAIRTTSHAFHLGGGDAPTGHELWESFDRDVLGCHYTGHYGNKGPGMPSSVVWRNEANGKHPILEGWPVGKHRVRSWLYKHNPLADSATPLLMGRVGEQEVQPVAWLNIRDEGGKVFYTMMGHPDEFETPEFVRLLKKGIYWAADLPVEDVQIGNDRRGLLSPAPKS